MTEGERTTVGQLREEFEGLWRCWDECLASVTPEQWQKRYGKDWIFADVPYHLHYFDRVMVIEPTEKGGDIPEEERFSLDTVRQLNEWNAREFAKRPASYAPEQSITLCREMRDRIRTLTDRLSDADLARPAWNHFFGFGWGTAGDALGGGVQHTWSELAEMRFRTGRLDVEPPASATRRALEAYVRIFPAFMDSERAKTTPFTVALEFTGPGACVFTIRVRDGRAEVREGKAAHADLVMTQSADTFMKVFKKLGNPMLLMLTGQLKVKGFSKMGTFGKLFAAPPPDRRVDAKALGASMTSFG